VAVETLARRLPSLRMEDQPLDWVPMFVPRGVQSLLVAWDAADAEPGHDGLGHEGKGAR
jgi:hypothetical protein